MKSKDDIYKAFLDEIDEDLCNMCEMNGKASDHFRVRTAARRTLSA